MRRKMDSSVSYSKMDSGEGGCLSIRGHPFQCGLFKGDEST